MSEKLVIDPTLSSKDNILALVNHFNQINLTASDVIFGNPTQPDSQDKTLTEVVTSAVERFGYQGEQTITYRRNDLTIRQNLVGRIKAPAGLTSAGLIQHIEKQAALVPGEIEVVGEPALVPDEAVTVQSKPDSLLYVGQMDFVLQPNYTNSLYGGQVLLKGNSEAGYFGQLPGDQLITSADLVKQFGLPSNNALTYDLVDLYHSDAFVWDNEWLKFVYNDTIVFISKQLISTASMDNLFQMGVVTGNNTIQLGDETFKIRLIYGTSDGEYEGTGDTTAISNDDYDNCEWADLLYSVADPQAARNNSPLLGRWDQIPGDALYVAAASETHPAIGDNRTYCHVSQKGGFNTRGRDHSSYGIDYARAWSSSYNDDIISGWRPVLELVPPDDQA